MKIETKFNVGDIVYYIYNYEIQLAKVVSYKIEYSNYSDLILIHYLVRANPKTLCETRLSEEYVFKSKKELLDYLDSKCLKEKLFLLRKK